MKKFFLPLFLFAAASVSAQKLTGKLSFQNGQKLEVVTTSNTTTEMMMGESASTATTTELYEVKSTADAGTTVERSMKKLKLNLSIMGQEKSIDSDNPEDLKGMIGEPIKDLLNTKNEFVIDGNGLIIAAKDAEKKSGGNDMMGMFLQGMNMGSGLAKGSKSFFASLPAYEVGKGDSWKDTTDMGGTSTVTTYSVKDITDTEVLLDFVSAGNIDSKQEMMGMSVSVKGTVKSNGTVIVDKATGLPKQKNITSVTDSAATVSGQEMNTKATTTAVITVKPI